MSLKCRVFVWGRHGNGLIFMAPRLSWQLAELMGHIDIIKLIIYHHADKMNISGEERTKPRNGNVLVPSARHVNPNSQQSQALAGKHTYLFFMRRTTPKKIMTKSRMPAMTPAILTVWSVCFSGSTASGLWVADPGRHSFKHQSSQRPKKVRKK